MNNQCALKDLYELNKFYSSDFQISHPGSSFILPSQQLFSAGLLNLFDVPDDLTGLYYMKRVMDHMIQVFEATENKTMSSDFELLYTKFWGDGSDAAGGKKTNRVAKRKSRGTRGDNPIYAFLFVV